MISTILVAQLLLVHFISDFLLQSDWMAQNKSKNTDILFIYCTVYGLPFLVFLNLHFVAFLILVHYIVDFITSRITAPMFKKWYDYQVIKIKGKLTAEQESDAPSLHYFFVVIGFDQWLHFVTLLIGVYLYGIK